MLARDDDIAATGEGMTDGFEGLAPHDHGMTLCEFTKVLEVCRKMPREFPLVANDIVLRDGSDEGDSHEMRRKFPMINFQFPLNDPMFQLANIIY